MEASEDGIERVGGQKVDVTGKAMAMVRNQELYPRFN